MDFANCYADANRTDAYATPEFANTYYLVYRDCPAIISEEQPVRTFALHDFQPIQHLAMRCPFPDRKDHRLA